MNTPSKWAIGLAVTLVAGAALAQNFDSAQQSSQNSSDPSTWSRQSSGNQYNSQPFANQQFGNNSSPTISRSEAEGTAMAQVPGGRIETGGLARENGKLVWSFDIANPNSQNPTEVVVDALTGNLVSVNQQNGSSQQSGQSGSQYSTANPQYGGQSYGYQQNSSQGNYGSQQQRIQPGQFVESKRLLGQEVNNSQGQTLGQIKDVVINTQSGQVFTILGIGNNQNAIVPVQALNVTGGFRNPQISLNATKQTLQSGPVVQNNQWLQALNNPGFTQRVYNHYNLQIQPGSEVGVVIVTPITPGASSGGSSAGFGGSSSGSGSTSNQQPDSSNQGNNEQQ